jgi:molecular chaperone Hsp33
MSTEPTGNLQLGLAGHGGLRWAMVELRDIVEAARVQRDLSPVAAAALGQMLAGTAMVLRMTSKQPTQLLIEARGDGPLGRVHAEADSDGGVRGMVEVPQAPNPVDPVGAGAAVHSADAEDEDRLAVRSALGNGTLRVVRQSKDGERYDSQVELVPGGVGQNLAHYLEQSRQIHSAVLLGVLARPEGVTAAGGVILEALPGVDEDVLAGVEARLRTLSGVARPLEEGGPEGLLQSILGDLEREILEERELRLDCKCDRHRFLRQLLSLAVEDREYLLDEGDPVRTQCTFCGTEYTFAPEDLSLTQ